MAGIEEVIARSRRGAGFSERRRFSLARDEALRKLRDFALADPHFYVLELVQAAVAGGARVIHVDVGPEHSLFAWQGWSLSRDELQHLLDYLFASQDQLAVARLRHLALGLNALRHFHPREIALESGDGRRAHRLALQPRGPEGLSLEVGEADQALDWSYVHATGLQRPLVPSGARTADEVEAIETRCLCTPVPILVGLRAPFGPGRQRIPRAWGYHPSVAFDEGDLTGTLGLAPRTGLPAPEGLEPQEARLLRFQPSVRLITYGVWVQSVSLTLVPGAPIGGAVSFDRLRKTADHSAVVRDEVFAELLVRLRPYALRLCQGGPAPGLHAVRQLAGAAFAPGALGPWLRAQGRVVVVPPATAEDGEARGRAEGVGQALQAPVIVCPPAELPGLRSLAGPDVSLVCPDLSRPEELRFFARPPAPPPPEPWLAAPLALPPLGRAALPAGLEGALAEGGAETGLEASLYAPAAPGPAGPGVWAQVLTSGRVVWEGRLASDFAGQWLVVRLPDTLPDRLHRAGGPRPCLAERLAAHVLGLAREAQATLAARVVRGLSAHGGLDCSQPAPQRLLLQALSRGAAVRFRAGLGPGAPPRLAASLLHGEEALLDVPAFATLSGARLSLRELLASLPATGGLVYTTVEVVPADLDGLERGRILALEAEGEARLAALLGSGCLCRVDRREVLAEAAGLRVRDMAVGLRTFADFPLQVEGADPAGLAAGARAEALRSLAAQLRARCLDVGADEEDRRQALRHLQWLALGGLRRGELEQLDELGLADLPLLLEEDGQALSPRRLAGALAEGRPLRLTLAGELGQAELAALRAAASARRPGRRPVGSVAASPFAAQLLARLGDFRLDFDFDLSDAEAEADPAPPVRAFLESAEVVGESVAGRVGIPAEAGVRGALVLLDERLRLRARLSARVPVRGLVGALRLLAPLPPEEALVAAEDALEAALERLGERLLLRLGGAADPLPAGDTARVEAVLLAYAGRRLRLVEDASGARLLEVSRPLVGRVLDLPLFPLGAPDGARPVHRASGRRLLLELCAFGPEALDDPRRASAWSAARAASPAHLAAWLDGLRAPGRLARLGRSPAPSGVEDTPATGQAGLTRALARWLHALGADGGGRLELPLQVELQRPPRALASQDPLSFAPWRLGAATCLLDAQGAPSGLRLVLNREHALTRAALARPGDPEALCLLLLASACLLQEQLHVVIPEDELAFQRGLCHALAAGQLGQEA
ncbi:MAG TPA: hypothetical protein PK668_18905 [Myxococcota bacterium]|nr:hypothetical protein [Myxococcota bacterium]HRY95200.1 hypothetical protein [Myxococcota bacterium]HSA20513.1 hypothetical protein [Myxococcota bacterium]